MAHKNQAPEETYFNAVRPILAPAGSKTEHLILTAQERLARAAGRLGINIVAIPPDQLSVTLLSAGALRFAHESTGRSDLTIALLGGAIVADLPPTFAKDVPAHPTQGFAIRAGAHRRDIGGVYGVNLVAPHVSAEKDQIGQTLTRETGTNVSMPRPLRLTLATSPEVRPSHQANAAYLRAATIGALRGHELTLGPVDFPPATFHEL